MCEQHSIKHTDYQVNTHRDILTELNKRGPTELSLTHTHMQTHTPKEMPLDKRSQAGQIKYTPGEPQENWAERQEK